MEHKVIEWFNNYADDLYNWAYYKTNSKENAEDLVQETFLSALKASKEFKNNSTAKTWLFAILNNKIVDFYRKSAQEQKWGALPDEQRAIDHADSLFSPQGDWVDTEAAETWESNRYDQDNPDFLKRMNHCMSELPENWKMALTFKYLDQKDGKEICQALGVTPSNYWQIIHRAKLILRECLNKLWSMGQKK